MRSVAFYGNGYTCTAIFIIYFFNIIFLIGLVLGVLSMSEKNFGKTVTDSLRIFSSNPVVDHFDVFACWHVLVISYYCV